MREGEPFELEVTYWPPGAGVFWWRHFQKSTVQRDLEHVRALGLSHLAVDLAWADFQPDVNRVSVEAMRSLEAFLDIAHDSAIKVTIALFPVARFGTLWLPSWALQQTAIEDRTVLTELGPSRRAPLNPFSSTRMVNAEMLLVREVVGAFADHPSVAGWVLGERLECVAHPGSAEIYQEWLGALSTSVIDAGCTQPLYTGIGADALVGAADVDPAFAGTQGVGMQIAAVRPPAWAGEDIASWLAFSAAYARVLNGMPAVVSHIGPGMIDRESKPDVEMERVLEYLHDAGAAGVRAVALCDFSATLRAAPPFSSHPGQLFRGLLTSEFRPKPVLTPWLEAETAGWAIRPVPSTMPEVDPDERRRDPVGTARAAFREFVQ